MNLPVIPVL